MILTTKNQELSQAKSGEPLCIGRQGENNARKVVFDLSDWQRAYGPGTAQLLVQRTGESTPYPAALTVDGSRAYWGITAADTAVPGQFGKAELRYSVNDTLVKSETWTTVVLDALGEPSETPPEAYQGWVDQVLAAGTAAENAANRAENAAARQPYPDPDTGTWWVWDAEAGAHQDSGISCGGSGSEEVFIAAFGTTTNAEIYEAYQAGKFVYCISAPYIMPLVYCTPTITVFGVLCLDGKTYSRISCMSEKWAIQSNVSLESVDQKVTALDETSTDTQYPSAKAVYDAIQAAISDTWEASY